MPPDSYECSRIEYFPLNHDPISDPASRSSKSPTFSDRPMKIETFSIIAYLSRQRTPNHTQNQREDKGHKGEDTTHTVRVPYCLLCLFWTCVSTGTVLLNQKMQTNIINFWKIENFDFPKITFSGIKFWIPDFSLRPNETIQVAEKFIKFLSHLHLGLKWWRATLDHSTCVQAVLVYY